MPPRATRPTGLETKKKKKEGRRSTAYRVIARGIAGSETSGPDAEDSESKPEPALLENPKRRARGQGNEIKIMWTRWRILGWGGGGLLLLAWAECSGSSEPGGAGRLCCCVSCVRGAGGARVGCCANQTRGGQNLAAGQEVGSSGQAGRQDDLETWSREISPCDTGSGGRSGVCAQPEVSKFPSSGQQRPLILFFFPSSGCGGPTERRKAT